jgi:hypothetical protein
MRLAARRAATAIRSLHLHPSRRCSTWNRQPPALCASRMRLTALRLADDTHMEGPRVRNQENVSAAHAGPSAPRGRQMPGPSPPPLGRQALRASGRPSGARGHARRPCSRHPRRARHEALTRLPASPQAVASRRTHPSRSKPISTHRGGVTPRALRSSVYQDASSYQ